MKPCDLLTDRELEVITLCLSGSGAKGVAQRLGISLFTAQSHLSNIRQKLNARSMVHAIGILSGWKPEPRKGCFEMEWMLQRFTRAKINAMLEGLSGTKALNQCVNAHFRRGSTEAAVFRRCLKVLSTVPAGDKEVAVNPR